MDPSCLHKILLKYLISFQLEMKTMYENDILIFIFFKVIHEEYGWFQITSWPNVGQVPAKKATAG